MSKLSQWKSREKSIGIPKISKGQPRLASSGQERLFFLQQLQGDSIFYQYGHIYKFEGNVDVAELELKFIQSIKRHDVLRSNYYLEGGQVLVDVKEDVDLSIEVGAKYDPSFFKRTFDLSDDLLIRAKLFEGNILALSIHHIIGDRQSLMILNKDIFGNSSDSSHVLDYFDFAAWSNHSIDKQKDLAYWRSKLGGELPLLSLPHDKRRSSNPSFLGKTHILTLNSRESSKLRQITAEQGVTMYVIILAAYNVLLSKYSNQREILIGTPVSNRDRKELENMVGFFNETLVLRSSIDGNKSFSSFVNEVKNTFLEGLSHKNVSFNGLVKEIKPLRIPGANPLFQAMFLYNKHDHDIYYDGKLVSEEIVDLGVSKFDLTLFAIEKNEEISLKLEYSTELFEESTAVRFIESLHQILHQISENVSVKIGELKVGHSAAFSRSIFPEAKILHNSILDLVDFSSGKIAASHKGEDISYIDLNKRSDSLAQKLMSEGVRSNDFVGLYTKRSIEMIIGMMAILKAGAAYLPLDPSYPLSRLSFMLADSGCKVVLSEEKLSMEGVKNIDIKKIRKEEVTLPQPVCNPDDFVYIIYTSGSSGEPKGVPITHRNLLHSTKARFEFYPQKPKAFLLLSSFSFDSSVAGIFWTLCTGGKLVLPSEGIQQDIDALSEIIYDEKVTHSLMLPSLYMVLLSYSAPPRLDSLKNIMVAGEACSSEVVEKHFNSLPDCKLYNEYGPTEGTVWCIAHEFKKENLQVAIGKPVPYYQAYILDKEGFNVPDGVIGELCIGGKGLAKGYWKREALTAEKFVEHKEFGRLYKTGDLAKFDNLGDLFFLGRADTQVKIRGHRVELNEIRSRILEISKASEAEVILKHNALLAYVDTEVKVNLNLPEYMTPTAFMVLSDFPRLPNGKIDIKNLPDPERKSIEPDKDEITTDLEARLLDIWRDLLKNSAIGIDDNFFNVGGDSLLSIQFVAIARKAGVKLFASALFEHQTVRKLAEHVEKFEKSVGGDVVVPLKKGGDRRPLFCIHGGGAHVFFYKKFAQYLSDEIPVYSFQPKSLDGESKIGADISAMASLYVTEMKKVQPQGPYQILGTCFSNAVAIEMAYQLEEKGDQVENLFIIDSAPVHLFGNDAQKENQTFQRFMDMLMRGDFSRIKSKIRRRIFGEKEWISPLKDATEADEVLKNTVDSLNQMYADYSWKPFSGKINFIRSSEFHGRKDKKYHMTQWKKLAKGGLDVSVVEGHHLTLFEDPEARGLAKEVGLLLSEER